ncbi:MULTISPECIES: hypothetical protein [unclassified Mesorhizobium]|uniref:hypothetical protein n=1 Tax=unclassified Mesorhizobium TaxID=325217 RepID=UPI0013E34E6A|nr:MULTISPECIES: hypothetical protein [unclassified Mesorhizobium]
MTKKDFIAIAKLFKQRKEFCSDESQDDLLTLAGDLADYCKTTNPEFDRKRFMTACGF